LALAHAHHIFSLSKQRQQRSRRLAAGGAELYLRFGGKKIKDIRNTTKKDRENQKENTNERQLFDAIRWRERKTFSSIRRARANFPLVMLSENSQHFPPVQSLSAALRLFSSPLRLAFGFSDFRGFEFVDDSPFKREVAHVAAVSRKSANVRVTLRTGKYRRCCTARVPEKVGSVQPNEKVIIEVEPAAKLKFIKGSYNATCNKQKLRSE